MKMILIFICACQLIFANTTIDFKKGWSLVGLSTTLSSMEYFNNKNVEIIWGFDATNQLWQGYSPEETLVQKMNEKEILPLDSLQSYQAFWIFSKDKWSLELDKPFDKTIQNSSLFLKKGWNLISISQDVITSNRFFDDALVWKYNEEWSVNDSSLNFPSFKDIKKSDGLWVKSDEDKEINIANRLSKLNTFDTEKDMLDYIRNMLQANKYFTNYPTDLGNIALEVSTSDTQDTSVSAVDATTTNLQENGVDEADILKNDGKYIYSVDNQNSQIFITSFEKIIQKDNTAVNTISMVAKRILSMYLQNNRLIVLSNNSYEYNVTPIKTLDASSPNAYSSSIIIDFYDVEDITNIKELDSYELEGNYNESRVVNGKLFLISAFYPEITYENNIIVREKLVPIITSGTTVVNLVEASKFYAPIKLNQRANITTISSFDINKSSYKESLSFLGSTHTYYASESSLYLISKEYPLYYDYENYKEQEMIYKFSITDSLVYEGRGFIEGRVLNQFSLSEKDNYLRIATTSGFSWGQTETENSVFILKSQDDVLKIEGELRGLGKSGETIKAVRFMNDRGFIVTFKQTDPLYTLDLSDPTNPKKVGELSIPGFSRYLHVVDENRVLSIGRDADEETGRTLGLQLQLFDISDFSKPLLADKVMIGDTNTYSTAEYNHKAFVYRPSDLMFGLPYRKYTTQTIQNFGIYQIDAMKINTLNVISKEVSTYSYWDSEKRGLIFDTNGSTYGVMIGGSEIISDTIK